MKKKIAAFGDAHGNLDALIELYSMLSWESLDELWHLGDLIDRGPDSEGVVAFCREFGIKGIMGNHEGAMLEKFIKNKTPPKSNQDKLRTYNQLMRDQRNIDYLWALPKMHVDLENNALFVHAGIYPWLPFYQQEQLNGGRFVCHVGMCHPDFPGASRWHGWDARRSKTEEEHRAQGWVRWYEEYDGSLDIYHGHRTTPDQKPEIINGKGEGKIYALDTGAWYWGTLTACVIGEEPKFFTTKAYPGKERSLPKEGQED